MLTDNKQLKSHVIVIGNEKGGAGKTTTSIHLIAYLLKLGFKVASFDLDARQRSLTRYLENRSKYNAANKLSLALPLHYIVSESNALNINIKEAEEQELFKENFFDAASTNDFVIIDTPGSNTFYSRIAHSYANTIVTPVNDSFLDLDVLAHFDADTYDIIKPSIYSELIWQQKIERAKRDRGEINWIVMRNRLSNLDAKNKRNVGEAIQKLANKIGFRSVDGFSERVIFKELFLHGLTLFDLGSDVFDIRVTISHLAAKEELKHFLKQLEIEIIEQAISNLDHNETLLETLS